MLEKQITIEEYNKDTQIAENQIVSGDVFTYDEIMAIIKKWNR